MMIQRKTHNKHLDLRNEEDKNYESGEEEKSDENQGSNEEEQ